ncbi:hypothetical protein [Bradyrhizobium sp. RT5a]|uniref:hypothetical protein n=1 Tax=unclassified Bradyrhizobium TaxID=2631580 RepID=UPI0033965997
MFKYSPPGSMDDLTGRPSRGAFLDDWHTFIETTFRNNIAGLGDHPLFFTEVDTPAESAPVPIGWNGFPLSLARASGSNRRKAWAAADVLQSIDIYTPRNAPEKVTTKFRLQDEYCEWHAYQNRIVFTAEGPEYWIKVAKHDIDAVVDLYKKLVDPAVQKRDLLLTTDLQYDDDMLLRAGEYNPFNVWNTEKGAMHLTHWANTLGAEINLAAVASVPRRDSKGQRVSEVRPLICCAGYGNANRSSDPTIGWGVNTTCLGVAPGAVAQLATLADPVGLYMRGLQQGSLTGPNDEPLDHWFNFVRGSADLGLMAIVEPPADSPFGLDKVKVKGIKLEFGGQIAECIDMVLYAKVAPAAGAAPKLVSCRGHCCMPAGTQPGHIKDINLDQPRGGAPCAAQTVEAYPGLLPASHLLTTALPIDNVVPAPASKKLRSRLLHD